MARVKRRRIECLGTECRATFDGGRCTVQVGQSRILGLTGFEDPAVFGHEILVCLTRVFQAGRTRFDGSPDRDLRMDSRGHQKGKDQQDGAE